MEARANVRTELMDRAEILHSAIQQLREEENNNKKKIITSSTNILEEEEEEEEGEQHLLARLLSQVRMRTTSDSNPKRYNLICYLSFRREQLFHFWAPAMEEMLLGPTRSPFPRFGSCPIDCG